MLSPETLEGGGMVILGRGDVGLGARWTWRVEDFPDRTCDAHCWGCGSTWTVDLSTRRPEERMVEIDTRIRCETCDQSGAVDFVRPSWG